MPGSKFALLKCVIYTTLLFIVAAVQAETYRVGIRTATEKEHEYSYSKVFPRVINAIGAMTDDTFVYVRLPPSRVKKYFNEGKIDIEPGTNPVWRRKEKVPGLFSIAFSKSSSVLLFKPGQQKIYDKFKNSRVFTMGTVRGYSYPTLEAKFSAGSLLRFDEVDETRLLLAILNGRLEQVVVSEQFARIWLKNNASPVHYEFGQVIDSKPLMMRVHPRAGDLLTRMNDAITQLIESGRMQTLTGIPMSP